LEKPVAALWIKMGPGSETVTRNPAIAEGPRDAGVPVEIW